MNIKDNKLKWKNLLDMKCIKSGCSGILERDTLGYSGDVMYSCDKKDCLWKIRKSAIERVVKSMTESTIRIKTAGGFKRPK